MPIFLMKLNFFQKILLIVALLGLTFLYSIYEKKKFYGRNDGAIDAPILKELPAFQVKDIASGAMVASRDFAIASKGAFVHIWGTWCAPCEKEMPEFLSYAGKVESLGVKFLLVAVNDEEMKIKKFLTRFPNIPKNVTFAIDTEGKVMDQLGTLKVPETFLFASNGKHINKFIGPQDWMADSYVTRLNFWLNGENLENRKIESH